MRLTEGDQAGKIRKRVALFPHARFAFQLKPRTGSSNHAKNYKQADPQDQAAYDVAHRNKDSVIPRMIETPDRCFPNEYEGSKHHQTSQAANPRQRKTH